MRTCIVMGTRPEIVKNYSIVQTFRQRNVDFFVLHTGQHFDPGMTDAVFDKCRYRPDRTMEGPYQLGRAIDWLSAQFRELRPDLVLVNGDTAAALAGAIAADYAHIDLAHVEAGLRSYDVELLEERNRQMVDSVARFLFTYTTYEAEFLYQRKELRGRIYNVGNTTVDFIEDFQDSIENSTIKLFIFATLHRRELLEREDRITDALDGINAAGNAIGQVLFPLHPHTAKRLEELGISLCNYPNITAVDPLDPVTAIACVKHCVLIITDSGVLQEEAYILGTPCVTIREKTERNLTVAFGANDLAGYDPSRIVDSSLRQSLRGPLTLPPIYGKPRCAERIADALLGKLREYRTKPKFQLSQRDHMSGFSKLKASFL